MKEKRFLIVVFLIAALFFSVFPGVCQEKGENEKEDPVTRLLSSGDELIRSGEFNKALEKYKEALEMEPENPECNYKVGVGNYLLGNYSKALNYFQKAVDLDPSHYKALNNLGYLYEKEDKFKKATRYYERAIKANPDYFKARYNLGRVLYNQGQVDKAEKVVRELVELKPGYDRGFYLLGLILETQEDFTEAAQAYKEALKLSSNANTNAAEGLKRIRARQKISDEEKEQLETARKIVPFKLPPGFEFDQLIKLESGVRVISINWEPDHKIYIVRFPDSYVLGDRSLKEILEKPGDELSQLLKDLKIDDLTLVKIESYELANNRKDESKESEKSPDEKEKQEEDRDKTVDEEQTPEKDVIRYARVNCSQKSQKMNGLVTIHRLEGSSNPLLIISLSSGKKVKISGFLKFLVNVGDSAH